MKKVFLIHGFGGTPNGGWRPWLMAELEKREIYACALAMPQPDRPKVKDWVAEIGRHISGKDEVYLIGHSLGVPAILHYLQGKDANRIAGAVLVSGPVLSLNAPEIEEFICNKFEFKLIKDKCSSFAIIHGDNDPLVPLAHARKLSKELGGDLAVIRGGGHLNGSAGFHKLTECLEILKKMLK